MTQQYRTSPARLPVAARFGVPVWSAASIVFASLITGALLSINFRELGNPFLWCFAAGSIAAVCLVEPRGLFLTTAQLPLAFAIALPLTVLGVNYSMANADSSLSRLEILAAIYPLTEQFPFLMSVTLITVVIALIRWLIARSVRSRAMQRTVKKQQQVRRINQENAAQASRARTAARTHRARGARSSQVTVQELMQQRRANSRHDDLYR
ncbi:MAG: amino acid permease [Corynebacterium sp.]|nr:amino acid permease [Corynebacterium sp.]